MSYCPSQDWDRYIGEQDAAAEAEMQFYRQHGAAIERISIALIGAGHYAADAIVEKGTDAEVALVQRAARIASLIYAEQES